MGKSLADSHLVFWKTEKMHRNVSMILIFEPGILYRRQDRSFSLRTLQRYADFYVLMLDHKNAQKRSALVVELTHEMQQCIPDSRNEDKVQGEQIGQNITAFLRTQSKQDRLLFMKRYWYGVSIKDLAQQMQISESSAKVRLHRIRGRLKKYLESEGIWI